MYVSKVWGFDVPCGPMVFGTEGWRDRASLTLKDNDVIILVGTLGEDTPEPDRNRVLGMMEPSTIPAQTSDFPLPWSQDHRIYRPDGSFRWPYALINKRAWVFEPGLFLRDIAPREGHPFGSVAAAGIVALNSDEAARALQHPHREVSLIQSSNPALPSPFEDAPRGKGAPTPSEGVRRVLMNFRDCEAHVYWFHLERNDKLVAHKIGWAFDWRNRLRHFNSAALPGLGGVHYQKYATYACLKTRIAFKIERRILKELDAYRFRGNQEVLHGISTDELQRVWAKQINATLFE